MLNSYKKKLLVEVCIRNTLSSLINKDEGAEEVFMAILKNLDKNGYFINNIDINLICEKPKVSRYRSEIISSLSNLLSINKDQINLKGKTVEKLGLIGKEKAIACEVIVSITKYD